MCHLLHEDILGFPYHVRNQDGDLTGWGDYQPATDVRTGQWDQRNVGLTIEEQNELDDVARRITLSELMQPGAVTCSQLLTVCVDGKFVRPNESTLFTERPTWENCPQPTLLDIEKLPSYLDLRGNRAIDRFLALGNMIIPGDDERKWFAMSIDGNFYVQCRGRAPGEGVECETTCRKRLKDDRTVTLWPAMALYWKSEQCGTFLKGLTSREHVGYAEVREHYDACGLCTGIVCFRCQQEIAVIVTEPNVIPTIGLDPPDVPGHDVPPRIPVEALAVPEQLVSRAELWQSESLIPRSLAPMPSVKDTPESWPWTVLSRMLNRLLLLWADSGEFLPREAAGNPALFLYQRYYRFMVRTAFPFQLGQLTPLDSLGWMPDYVMDEYIKDVLLTYPIAPDAVGALVRNTGLSIYRWLKSHRYIDVSCIILNRTVSVASDRSLALHLAMRWDNPEEDKNQAEQGTANLDEMDAAGMHSERAAAIFAPHTRWKNLVFQARCFGAPRDHTGDADPNELVALAMMNGRDKDALAKCLAETCGKAATWATRDDWVCLQRLANELFVQTAEEITAEGFNRYVKRDTACPACGQCTHNLDACRLGLFRTGANNFAYPLRNAPSPMLSMFNVPVDSVTGYPVNLPAQQNPLRHITTSLALPKKMFLLLQLCEWCGFFCGSSWIAFLRRFIANNNYHYWSAVGFYSQLRHASECLWGKGQCGESLCRKWMIAIQVGRITPTSTAAEFYALDNVMHVQQKKKTGPVKVVSKAIQLNRRFASFDVELETVHDIAMKPEGVNGGAGYVPDYALADTLTAERLAKLSPNDTVMSFPPADNLHDPEARRVWSHTADMFLKCVGILHGSPGAELRPANDPSLKRKRDHLEEIGGKRPSSAPPDSRTVLGSTTGLQRIKFPDGAAFVVSAGERISSLDNAYQTRECEPEDPENGSMRATPASVYPVSETGFGWRSIGDGARFYPSTDQGNVAGNETHTEVMTDIGIHGFGSDIDDGCAKSLAAFLPAVARPDPREADARPAFPDMMQEVPEHLREQVAVASRKMIARLNERSSAPSNDDVAGRKVVAARVAVNSAPSLDDRVDRPRKMPTRGPVPGTVTPGERPRTLLVLDAQPVLPSVKVPAPSPTVYPASPPIPVVSGPTIGSAGGKTAEANIVLTGPHQDVTAAMGTPVARTLPMAPKPEVSETKSLPGVLVRIDRAAAQSTTLLVRCDTDQSRFLTANVPEGTLQEGELVYCPLHPIASAVLKRHMANLAVWKRSNFRLWLRR